MSARHPVPVPAPLLLLLLAHHQPVRPAQLPVLELPLEVHKPNQVHHRQIRLPPSSKAWVKEPEPELELEPELLELLELELAVRCPVSL